MFMLVKGNVCWYLMSQYIGLVHHLVLNKMEKGELNIDSKEALRNVLKEYEIHTKIIEEQLEMCKKDHADLRLEMSRLVNENRDLYEKLKVASENALQRTDLPALEGPEVENLQLQLSLALEEKDTLEAWWKSSVQEVDALREKLQEYQSGKPLLLIQNRLDDVQKDYTEVIKILENKQNTLKMENDQLNVKCEVLEDQLKQANMQMASVTEKNLTLSKNLNESTEQEQQWKSQYFSLEGKFIELEKSYQAEKVKYNQIHEYEKVESNLKEKLEDSRRERDKMQTALERCYERIEELGRNAANDRLKVEEAVALVEGACRDKEEALAREQVVTEETKKLRGDLERLVDEAGRRIVQEEASLRKQFDSQLAAVKDQLNIMEQERNRKRVEVEQLQKECERLQGLVTQGQAAKTDRQLDKLTKQVGMAERTCEQLRVENETLREALDKLEEKCKRNSNHRQKLKNDLQKLVKDTQFYQQELAMSEQKADLLNSQLQSTSLDLAQLQSKTILNRHSAAGIEPQVSLTSTLELYKKLNESYGQMNEKWKKEMSALTDRFEAKLKKTKKESKVCFSKENPISK